ncbi:MAG: hypothetical protein JSR40_09460 [Proteobacteria bacterium]|nr:hypothetical protein [Pseudomonadota bacterium]
MSSQSLLKVLDLHRASLLSGDTALAYVGEYDEIPSADDIELDRLRRMRERFLRGERVLLGLRLLHAAATGLCVMALVVIGFVLGTPAAHAAALFALGLFALPVLATVSLVALGAKRRMASARNRIARTLYQRGLRIDGRGRVVTNAAYPRVVLAA